MGKFFAEWVLTEAAVAAVKKKNKHLATDDESVSFLNDFKKSTKHHKIIEAKYALLPQPPAEDAEKTGTWLKTNCWSVLCGETSQNVTFLAVFKCVLQ